MTQVTFKLSELDELLKNSDSGVTLIPNCVKHLTLSPFQLADLKNCVRNHLYSTVAKYDPQLDGIILSYKRIKIEDFFSIQIDGKSKFRYRADIYVFKPKTGSILSGVINKKGSDHLGCLVHRVFNIAIPRPDHLSDEDSWIGSKLQIGHDVQFKVVDVDLNEDMPYIKGELINVPGACDNDNYNVEDMEIDDDGEIRCDKILPKSNRNFLKEKCKALKSEIFCENDCAIKCTSENSVISNTLGVQSCAQVFMKEYYNRYRKFFSKFAGSKLFSNVLCDTVKYKSSKNIQCNTKLLLLIFCDFLNYDNVCDDLNVTANESVSNVMRTDELVEVSGKACVSDNENIYEVRMKNKNTKKRKKKKERDLDFHKKMHDDIVFKDRRNYKRSNSTNDNCLDVSDSYRKRKHILKNKSVCDNLEQKKVKNCVDDDVVVIKEVKINKRKDKIKTINNFKINEKLNKEPSNIQANCDSSDVVIVEEVRVNNKLKDDLDNEVKIVDCCDNVKNICENSVIDVYSSFLDSQMNFKKLVKNNRILLGSLKKSKHNTKKEKKKKKKKKSSKKDRL